MVLSVSFSMNVTSRGARIFTVACFAFWFTDFRCDIVWHVRAVMQGPPCGTVGVTLPLGRERKKTPKPLDSNPEMEKISAGDTGVS
jgi:hypothetical protein